MKRMHSLIGTGAVLTLVLAALHQPAVGSTGTHSASASTMNGATRTVRLDGAAKRVGNGTARAYIVVDDADAPVEIGVALSEGVMEGLPAPSPMKHQVDGVEHLDMHSWILELPSRNPTRYTFVQFGWNPQGHEPPGVWDTPHFDFHFYTVGIDVRNAIVPSDPKFSEKAARYPAKELVPPFYLDAATAARRTPAEMTVPEMGTHWFDVRTPEVQKLTGKPEAYRPFTTTYIYGTWNGEFIFAEPMITRAYLLSKRAAKDAAGRDTVIAVPAAGFPRSGSYAQAYRITFDEKAREYRIALTQFTPKQ